MKSSLELTTDLVFKAGKHQRQLRLTGAKNFRDLGGYRTADGRSVRWGVVYRSDSLHKLTNSDLGRLAALNLATVFDFRAEHEAEREPDRLPEGVRLMSLPMEDASTKVWYEARDEMVKNMKTLDPAYYMIKTNVELATKFTPTYKQFFHELLASNGRPIMFHCAAGKDRTGFAAALLLKMLGVRWDTIMQDYLLTNKYFLGAYKWNLAVAGIIKGRKFADGILGFMKADERYLSAAFTAIVRDHGSLENYVRDGLGLNEHDVERLKNMYLVVPQS